MFLDHSKASNLEAFNLLTNLKYSRSSSVPVTCHNLPVLFDKVDQTIS